MTCHRSAPIARQQFGVYTSRAVGDFLGGAVAGRVLADPEAFAVGVDGGQVNGAAGAAGDETEGVQS